MERAIVNIANQLVDNGYSVDLLLAACKGDLFEEVDKRINIICLDKKEKYSLMDYLLSRRIGKLRLILVIGTLIGGIPKALKCIKPLCKYISNSKPDLILSTPMTANIAVIEAARLSSHKPVIILREASNLSEEKFHSKNILFRHITSHVRMSYSRANRIICVSEGVKNDLVNNYGIDKRNCIVIRNPINNALIISKSKVIDKLEEVYDRRSSYIFAMGRLEEQKDFKTLIKAYSLCHEKIPHNLLIMGDGSQRDELQSLITKLNIKDKVFMPGFVKNPYPYLSKCELFVLSSRWEGLANVLREAMVFNKKIVATDCPSGTKEILATYNMGKLVKIGDYESMGQSILEMIDLDHSDFVSHNSGERELDYLNAVANELS